MRLIQFNGTRVSIGILVFIASVAAHAGVNISSPKAGTVSNPVKMEATATSLANVTSMQIYDNSAMIDDQGGSSISLSKTLTTGSHTLVFKVWYNGGSSSTMATVQINVSSSSSGGGGGGSGSGLVVNSPVSGTSVYNPVTLSDGSSFPNVSSMQLYDNGKMIYDTPNDVIQDSLNMTQGSHTLMYKVWYNSGSSSAASPNINIQVSGASTGPSPAPSPVPPTGPSGSITISNIDDTAVWNTCGSCGDNGGSGPVAHYSETKNTSVSLDGSSDLFSISGPAFANAYWWAGHPTVSNTFAYLAYQFSIYIPSAYVSAPQAIEFEVQQDINGYIYNFAWQDDYANGVWRTFNYGAKTWDSSGLEATHLTGNTWHTIKAEYHASGTTIYHDALTIDGTRHTFNITHSADKTGASDAFHNAFQLDSNPSGTPYKVYVDKMSVTYKLN
jgi:hypothetical protein